MMTAPEFRAQIHHIATACG